jgi:hypothetical protein
MKSILQYAALAWVFVVGVGLLVKVWVDTPTVILHYPDGYCLGVESPNRGENCENLPKKFQVEWRI